MVRRRPTPNPESLMRPVALIVSSLALALGACGTSGSNSCNGCETGPVGGGSDSITLTGVNGITDGSGDAVVVTGNYSLKSATTATLTSTCNGQSSGERKAVSGGDAGFTLNVDFQSCTTDIVKVTLFPPGESSSNNYVKCCFKKGTDF
jgi:hypothetical protein